MSGTAGYLTKQVHIFYCSADEDLQIRNELDKQLNVLKSSGWVQSWHEGEILPGVERDREVERQLNAADIILLFVSAHFLSSERCYPQMQVALRRHENKQAIVIPLLIRPVNWQDSPLGTFRILPENGLPVTQWNNRDEALYTIANEIQMVVKTLLKGVYLASIPADSSFVLRLQRDLEERGILVWSTSKEQKSDREKMQRMIRASHILGLIVSPSIKHARSLKEELRIANMYQKRIVPLWVAGNTWQESAPQELIEHSYLDGRTSEEYGNALEKIVTLYKRVATLHESVKLDSSIFRSPTTPLLEPRNPYKALNPFTTSDEDIHDFFGREQLTNELVEAIREMLTIKNTERFLTVIGPSGAGKSSVVMAGLLPRLRQGGQGVLSGSENWVYLTPMRPGPCPVEALSLVLAYEWPGVPDKAIYEDLDAEDARGLYRQASRLMKSPKTKVVLVVDQFEELFTLSSEQEKQRFIDLLVAAATDSQSPVIVIVTLRADFYDRPMNYTELLKLIQAHSRLAPPMDIDELRAVIEKPAALPDVQVSFDEDLVGDLLFEIRGQAGALPLLEFTLDQLFQRRRGQQLTRQAYEEIGGVKGALSKHAEETYATLPSEEHRQLARTLFLRLIVPGVTEQDTTRRKATLSELDLPDPKQKAIIKEVADIFVNKRLLTTNKVGGTETIEVSHEALIREWKRLNEWMREARDDILFQKALSEDVTAWEQHKQPRERLYRGTQLKDALEWARHNTPSEREEAFLRASRERRIHSVLGLVVVVLLLVSSAGVAGWFYLTQPPDPTLVRTLQDNIDGSLRYCINKAPSGSKITFAQGLRGTIKLIGSLEFVSGKQLTILGPGADLISISSGATDSNIHISEGATLKISGLSFKNSRTRAFAFLYNEGTLTVTRSIISDNQTTSNTSSYGGGIENYTTGTLTVEDSLISNNLASADLDRGRGGGIHNEGKLTVIRSTFSNNSASSSGFYAWGGGLLNYNTGIATVTDSTFSGNSASGKLGSQGGGIENEGTLTVTDSTFSGNSAGGQQGQGGGIQNDGKLTVIHSTFSNNSASGIYSFGGGIVNTETLIVTDSTFSRNKSSGKQGGQGGGIDNEGKLTAINSTFWGNTATGGSDYGGGGISFADFNLDSNKKVPFAANIQFCTLYGNSSSAGGGIWVDPQASGHLMLSSNLIAANRASAGPDIEGVLISGGYNLVENAAGAPGLNASTDRQVALADLKIAAMLGNNGGPTQTVLLLQGSLAIDVVPQQLCNLTFTDINDHKVTITTDQRGEPRPDGSENACDIGAYESSY